MQQEMNRPMTEAEESRHKAGTAGEIIAEDRIWNKRPDGLAIKMATTDTAGEFVIPEFKRMSDVTDQYVTRARNVPVNQYASIKSALERTLGPRNKTYILSLARMVGEPEKLHSGSKIPERAGPTRQPSLLQGPESRHRVH